jgi:hypothetical protein
MESLGYFLIALGLPLLGSALSLVIFLAARSQRLKPGLLLISVASASSLASFVLVLALATFFGAEALDAFSVGLVLASWAMAAPVLVRAFSRLT